MKCPSRKESSSESVHGISSVHNCHELTPGLTLTSDTQGYGIINATGDLWRKQRKAGLKFFSGANLETLVEDVLPEVYADTQKRLLQAASDGALIDLQQVFLDLTTTVVGHMAYDVSGWMPLFAMIHPDVVCILILLSC
jgi:hypothetical protein